MAELVLKGHIRNWPALTIGTGGISPPAQQQAHRPPPTSRCRTLPQEQPALHPDHSHYWSLPINQLYFFRKLKSCHKENTTFLRLPYTGGNYPESQVNLQGSPSAQCTALHQVEVSTALQKPCLGQQLPHDIPHPHLCSVPWPKPSAPTGHSVTETCPHCCCDSRLGQLLHLQTLTKFNIHCAAPGQLIFHKAFTYQPPFISLHWRLPSYLAPSKGQTLHHQPSHVQQSFPHICGHGCGEPPEALLAFPSLTRVRGTFPPPLEAREMPSSSNQTAAYTQVQSLPSRGTSSCPQGMKRKAEGMAQPTSTTPLPTQSLAPAASPAAATREHFFPSLLSARLTD